MLSKPLFAFGILLPALSLVQSAFAQTPAAPEPAVTRAACVAAYESVQISMKRSSLSVAREHARICLDDACSPTLRADCATWLAEIDKKQSSFVVRYRDGRGALRSDVAVFVDGKPVATSLDGRGISIDPGPHLVRIEPAGAAAMEESHVFNEGAKLVSVEFSRAPLPDPSAASSAKPAELARPIPLATWIAGGIGTAAAISFVTFAILGKTGQNRLDQCRPNCIESDVSNVRSHYTIADVSLGVSAAGVATAMLFYLFRPARSVEPESAQIDAPRGAPRRLYAAYAPAWSQSLAPALRIASDGATIGLQGALP